ncbi:tetratricopeptide repeat protein [Pelagicoccus sp. SDUM812002]|uniref:tetratricopeptide repeat protein n=1 Tax=Pelagicoccus sp. SDUM812002 TaxID=3041266 RepID=UPI00280DB648|nr:tetratricopeptide repeat protein [Pelagicoccus sp. SDUM812002]MDQ8185220.1 tetratricopeptide repeat protein [Pelagicoccus sp. SDUM812002]
MRRSTQTLTGKQAEESLVSLSVGLGQGITLAALGGYRNIAANLVWVSMYGDWRYRLKSEVAQKMMLAVSLNPDSIYFWIDGSRILANDMPVWQVGDELMNTLFTTPEGLEIRKKYGEQALAFLDKAPERLSQEVPILVEKAAISWRRLEDFDRALAYFKQAVAIESVPNHICRVYAEVLVKNGQVREAYEYLKSHYATLSDDDHTALKPFVSKRIEELKGKLDAGS